MCFKGPSDWFRRHTSFTVNTTWRAAFWSSELLGRPGLDIAYLWHHSPRAVVSGYLSVCVNFHSSSSWSVLQLWNNAVSRLTGERIIHHQPRNFSFLTLTMMHSRKKTYSKTCDIFSPKLSIGAYRMICLKLHAVLPSRSIYCNLQGKIKIISRRVHSVYAVSAYISDDLIGCY